MPQLEVRQCISESDLNPPRIHIHHGNKDTVRNSRQLASRPYYLTADVSLQSYFMYLDDGASRDSAPAYLPQYKYK